MESERSGSSYGLLRSVAVHSLNQTVVIRSVPEMDRSPTVKTKKKVIKKQKDPRITQKRCQKVDER